MRLERCGSLQRQPLTGVWFRAIHPSYWQSSLDTAYTSRSRSRYSAGPDAEAPFEIFYLCENGTIALEEIGAQFRHPTTGRIFTAPVPSLIINVEVTLQQVVNLTDIAQQHEIETTAQELTGDWRAYWYRHPYSAVPHPYGIAPTQAIGQALFNSPGVEAFLAISAKLPDHPNLVVFPQKLLPGSELKFVNHVANQTHVVAG